MYVPARKVQVALVSGGAFGDEDCIRISYATSNELLREAIRRIKQHFQSFIKILIPALVGIFYLIRRNNYFCSLIRKYIYVFKKDLNQLFDSFNKLKIIIVGDIMVDSISGLY